MTEIAGCACRSEMDSGLEGGLHCMNCRSDENDSGRKASDILCRSKNGSIEATLGRLYVRTEMMACVGAEDGWNSQLGCVSGSCTGPSLSETNQSTLSLLHPCGRLHRSAAKPGLGTDGPSE